MKKFILALLTALIVIGADAPAVRAQADPQLDALVARVAESLATYRRNLAYFDQANRIAVAEGRMSAADADAQLQAKAREFFDRDMTDGDFSGLADAHRVAVENWLAGIASRVGSSSTWPQGGDAESWRALGTTELERLKAQYDRWLTLGLDPLPALRRAATVSAWSQGHKTLTPELDPFYNQDARIAAAIPDERARAVVSATIEATPPTPSTGTSGTGTGSGETGTGETGPQTGTGTGEATGEIAPPVIRDPQPPIEGVRATLALEWRGMDDDKVGVWGNGNPDGLLDGHFVATLTFDGQADIRYIELKSADPNGAPIPPHHWSSIAQEHYVLGVWMFGEAMNTTHVDTLVTVVGGVAFDLYAAQSGDSFDPGGYTLVEIGLTNGQVLTAFTRH